MSGAVDRGRKAGVKAFLQRCQFTVGDAFAVSCLESCEPRKREEEAGTYIGIARGDAFPLTVDERIAVRTCMSGGCIV